MYFSDSLIRISRKWHKTARAKIPDNLVFVHKLMILYLFESRHSQVSKTVFIWKLRLPVAKMIKFEF